MVTIYLFHITIAILMRKIEGHRHYLHHHHLDEKKSMLTMVITIITVIISMRKLDADHGYLRLLCQALLP